MVGILIPHFETTAINVAEMFLSGESSPHLFQLLQVPLQFHLFEHRFGFFQVFFWTDAIKFVVLGFRLKQAIALPSMIW
jgi:hypothetical protein